MSISAKLEKNPPHKLLALDGGGIRGVMTLEILREIERMLQQELGRDDSFVLADYFDYVAGTSTGAIIATCLSLGWRVVGHPRVLRRRRPGDVRQGQRAEALPVQVRGREARRACSGSRSARTRRSASAKLRTLLLLVMRNATTDSPWPVSNNPRAKYNDPARADSNLHVCRCGSWCGPAPPRRPTSRRRPSRSASSGSSSSTAA